MRYGFVIDNRKCIGCHACTVACKSEHDVPLGVNRTWVKQVEKGSFPNTRRMFSVMRCNHCTDAPCVTICPTQALFIRADGIVDFDNRRCIGCKSCMQACPYDALYIDPETHTAAKCNYCAHRVDLGLQPACVIVCPEHAILSGDLDDPASEIAQTVAREQVTVRRADKGTRPNLFYVNGDESSLNPSATERSESYIWNSQSAGVGHFARYAQSRPVNPDVLDLASRFTMPEQGALPDPVQAAPTRQVEVLLGKARRVYDTPDKGLLWGREVYTYVWTKALSSGVVLAMGLMGPVLLPDAAAEGLAVAVGLVFLLLTGLLLVADLDQPRRFLYVLFRPHWKSWLVRGGYLITGYGAALALWGIGLLLDAEALRLTGRWLAYPLAFGTAVYTAFLFAQAKGRDFWQSPVLALHMLVHAVMAGAALLAAASVLHSSLGGWGEPAARLLAWSIGANLLITAAELSLTHANTAIEEVVHAITRGFYRRWFWGGLVLVGNAVPMLVLTLAPAVFPSAIWLPLCALLVLVGLWIGERIWVEAPQRLPLS
ncbi:MAG: 4Fe-4S dicluster domain-containing protein [Bacteroidetes bacterium]|nr:4Fe-4S dicluster domain-containing protein [Bacteroidota bacterium]